MLQSLYVKNLALIDETEVNFKDGLNILTGETGAGKSIIIGSINLALGAKADKELIRGGAEYALVELVFLLDRPGQTEAVKALELPVEDNQIIIQRKIMPNRNVCKVCGETVTARQLKLLAQILIDIHGQHEHQSLLQAGKQLEILDAYAEGELDEDKAVLRQLYADYRQSLKELSENDVDEETRKRETSLLVFECREIEEAELLAGEDEEVEKTYQKLLNGQKIKEAANSVHGLCGYENDGAGSSVGRALRELKAVTACDETLSEFEGQLLDIDSLLNDFNRSMAEYLSSLEFDAELFDRTEKRLNLLNYLKAKYGNSIEEILDYQNRAANTLAKYQDYDTYRMELQKKVNTLKGEVLSLCEKLADTRRKNAAILSEEMKRALADLNFQEVGFEIRVDSDAERISAEGFDRVAFLISTNRGEDLKELAQVASGGELSRIMLALKMVLADKDETGTLIFDEIDAGISGKTAWKVSEKMGILGKGHQIICITHLPQIAAMADFHYCIEKNIVENRSVTDIRSLDEEESIMELARMLGGADITDNTLNNAREMKELATKSK